jgi:hypothetical protein
MATFTRVNGYSGNYTTGTLRTTADLKAFVLTIRSTSNGSNTAIDLQAQDGDALLEADQLVEQIIKELNPLMYHVPSANAGAVHLIMHGHAVDADSIKSRLVGMVSGASTIGTDTAVTLGTAITVS